jgi:hypothetical protein
LVGLVEDNVGVDVDDGNVDTEGVGFVVGVLDFGLGRGGWRRRRFLGFLLFLEDNVAGIGLGAGIVRGCLGGLGLLLRRRRGSLGVRGGRRKEGADDRAYGEEKEAGRKVSVGGHRLKLYSDCWTALKSDGENSKDFAAQRLALVVCKT